MIRLRHRITRPDLSWCEFDQYLKHWSCTCTQLIGQVLYSKLKWIWLIFEINVCVFVPATSWWSLNWHCIELLVVYRTYLIIVFVFNVQKKTQTNRLVLFISRTNHIRFWWWSIYGVLWRREVFKFWSQLLSILLSWVWFYWQWFGCV